MGANRRDQPRKKPVQGRSRFTVEQILEAAAQVFAERGFAGATTNRIAERAGVSIGSLYQYFPNKDAVLQQLVSRHVDEGVALFETMLAEIDVAAHDLRDLLALAVSAAVNLHTSNPRFHAVLLSETDWSSSSLGELHLIEKRLAARVGALLEAHPQVHVGNGRCAAYILIHVVKDLAHEFVVHPPDGVGESEFTGEVVAMLARYLDGGGTP